LVFQIALVIALAGLPQPLARAQQNSSSFLRRAASPIWKQKQQSRRGDVTSADGDVDIHYGDTRLRATTSNTTAGHLRQRSPRPHFSSDYKTSTSKPMKAHYNVSTGHGLFHQCSRQHQDRTPAQSRHPDSDSPLYFEARDVERSPATCTLSTAPGSPFVILFIEWQFYAPNARIHLGKTVALINATSVFSEFR